MKKKYGILMLSCCTVLFIFGIVFYAIRGTFSATVEDIQPYDDGPTNGHCENCGNNPSPSTDHGGGSEIIDTPTPSSSQPTNTNVEENAQTGGTAIYIVFAIALATGTFAFLFYKKNSFNQM